MFRQPFSWRDMERLRRDMDLLFERSLPLWQRQRVAKFPAINVWTNKEEGIVVTAELPGVHPDDINISVTGDTLTLSGSRQPVATTEATQYHRRERVYGEFNRTFQLPYVVNKDKVEASVQQGVLQVTLPRAESEKPKQIAVRAS